MRPSKPESFHCLNHNHFSKVLKTWYPFRANAFAILCWQSASAMVS
nr:MAG TPA: NADH-ubiquinone oxidoreductase subunit b14.5b (NDUFC2) [Bacteriophage sp.]